MRNAPLTIFIGHDGRESIATKICEQSLRDHSSESLAIHRLHEPTLRQIGIYRREWFVTNGQKHDGRDRKPFSTDFAFTRFLVPAMMQYRGWALFVDGDFLFLSDVAEIFDQADPEHAVEVVKRSGQEDGGTKMDGQVQQPYFRKNWSSLMLLNCSHPSNQRLTPHVVNTSWGQWLHGFQWLEDDEIGAIDPMWNWLSGIDPQPKSGDPYAVHFTRGIPDMPGCQGSPYAEHWRKVKARL